MDEEFAKKLLDILIENSARILRAGFGVNRAEASFFDVIDLLREDESLRDHFLNDVRITLEKRDPSGLEDGSVPRELIELAVHELRWPQFRSFAETRIQNLFGGNAALARSDMAHSILEAYRDTWEDREFYKRYGA